MTEREALRRMVPPSKRRPRVYLGGIMQIMVTRACNLSCVSCSAGSNLGGRPMMMTVEQFEQACVALKSYFGVVGVFGGNPAIHPKFDEICRVMREHIPFERRGLWCNALMGKGEHARATFDPRHSNLNVHMDRDAYAEFSRDWPESIPYLKGLDEDSKHGSPWVSMIDLGVPEDERWNLISKCDINQNWSGLIGVFRGELRIWFCEVAAHQAMLNEDNPDWAGTGGPMPDTGLPVGPDCWKRPMSAYEHQVHAHCHHCGVPMRRPPRLAIGGEAEEFSATHRHIARPKVKSRPVVMVESIGMAGRPDRPATQYLPGTTPGYRGD